MRAFHDPLYSLLERIDQINLDPNIVGDAPYETAREVQLVLQRYKDLQDISAILGIDELGEEEKVSVSRARKVERFFS